MSGDTIDSMDKKGQPSCSRQTNLSVIRVDGNSNKSNSDWKRDNYGGKFPNNDGFRKHNQQRTAALGLDSRRPRERRFISNCQKEEMTKPSLNMNFEESGAICTDAFGRKSKKAKNLNHMVNFYYTGEHHTNFPNSGARHKGNYNRSYRSFNKERFLQASCQFVVKLDGHYALHAIDPDVLTDWDLVLQVRLIVHEISSCPICLYPPKAAKITKCGHVYCWPCILHYLSLATENKTWTKCPICCETVCEKDLRSMTAIEVTKYEPGMQITMKLMKKLKGEVAVAPCTSWQPDSGHLKSVRDLEHSSYSKLLIADDDYLENIVECQKTELLELMEDEPDSLETTYILAALQSLEKEKVNLEDIKKSCDKKKGAKQEDTNVNKASPDDDYKKIPSDKFNPSQKTNFKSYLSAFDEEEISSVAAHNETTTEQDDDETCASPEVDANIKSYEDELPDELDSISLSQISLPKINTDGRHVQYFYQAADGQYIYMHSLNVRCLKAEHTSLDLCPIEIVAKIVDVEEFTINEDNRRRLSYLSHLPTSCQFRIVELDLLPPLVSEDSLKVVANQIRARQKDREVREKRDKRNAAKIQRMENKQMGIEPGTRIVRSDYPRYLNQSQDDYNFNGDIHFPEIQKPSSPNADNEILDKAFDETSSECTESGLKEEASSWMSFAQMLKSGKAKHVVASDLKAKSKCEQNPLEPKACSKKEDSDEEKSEVPEFSMSWNVDLAKKLDDARKITGKENGNKKKKNKQGILLFATGAAGPRCK